MTDELRIEIETTSADVVAFRKHVTRQIEAATAAQRGRRRLWILGVAFGLVVVGSFLDGWFGLGNASVPSLQTAVWIAFFVTFFVLLYAGDMRVRQRVVFADADARLPRRATYIFSAEGASFRLADREGIVRWQGIAGLDETEEHFFMMLSLTAGWVLPKRLLSATDADTLRHLFQVHAAAARLGAS